jgi:tRNA dimethylallyltransferase
VDPGESLSAAAFKQLAASAINDIWERGLTAYVVGGSGLYIDALLFDYQFPAEADPQVRARLEAMSNDELRELLAAEDPEAFERVDIANRRRVIRAIETAGQPRQRSENIRSDALLLGLSLNKDIAHQRITARVQKMLDKGFLAEVETIGRTYGWDSPALEVIGYRAFKEVVHGNKSVEDGAVDFVRGDMALYKKQLTWFKRNQHIQWLDSPADAGPLVAAFLGR